jgi:hypothetical protein
MLTGTNDEPTSMSQPVDGSSSTTEKSDATSTLPTTEGPMRTSADVSGSASTVSNTEAPLTTSASSGSAMSTSTLTGAMN